LSKPTFSQKGKVANESYSIGILPVTIPSLIQMRWGAVILIQNYAAYIYYAKEQHQNNEIKT
jgi:hypothetical protein